MTGYPVLDPLQTDPGRRDLCALAIMAKAPRPGKVKTRLSPPLSPEQAALLNICFLQDTARNISEVATIAPAAGVISYTPVGDEALFAGLLPQDFVLIAQRGDGFGERLLATAGDLLACGYGAVCLIDSDSPTLPSSSLTQAVTALMAPGDRIVLGGSVDGGYYLIGLKAPHREPFEQIHWSTATVFQETAERIRTAGIELVELPLWYDIDDAKTLDVVQDELLRGVAPSFARSVGYAAESTRAFLKALTVDARAGGRR